MENNEKKLFKDKSAMENREAAMEEAVLPPDIEVERAKVRALERKVIVLSMGVPAEKADAYTHLAAAYAKDGIGFEEALKKALLDFPLREPVIQKAVMGAQKGAPGTGAYTPPRVI